MLRRRQPPDRRRWRTLALVLLLTLFECRANEAEPSRSAWDAGYRALIRPFPGIVPG